MNYCSYRFASLLIFIPTTKFKSNILHYYNNFHAFVTQFKYADVGMEESAITRTNASVLKGTKDPYVKQV